MMRGRLRIPRAAIAQRAFAQYAQQLNARLADLRPAWDAVRAIIFASTADRFEKEGRRGGFRKWRALSNTPNKWCDWMGYKDWKMLHFPGKPILQLTGRLRDQLTGISGDHFEWRERSFMMIGSNYPVDSGEGHDLGGIHAVGRRFPPMPARSPFGITITDEKNIVDAIVDYVTGTSTSGATQYPMPELPSGSVWSGD